MAVIWLIVFLLTYWQGKTLFLFSKNLIRKSKVFWKFNIMLQYIFLFCIKGESLKLLLEAIFLGNSLDMLVKNCFFLNIFLKLFAKNLKDYRKYYV